MTRHRRFALLATLLLTLGTPPGAEAAAPGPLQIDLPGALVAGAVSPGDEPGLWLLTREDDVLSLHRFLAGPSPALALRVASPPSDVRGVASADLDGDGELEPVLLSPGAWWTVGSLEVPGIRPVHQGSDRWVEPPPRGPFRRPSVAQPTRLRVGELAALRSGADGPGADWSAKLPVRAEARPWGLRLSSPRMVPHPAGGWVGWQDPQRNEVEVTRIREDGSAVALQLVLPEPERLESARPLAIDGAPFLFLSTFVSMGPMANQRIRLFPLPDDPGPVSPVLAEELDTHIWHTIEPYTVDLDGDGTEELVVASPEGMGGGTLRLREYPGTPATRFRGTPTELRVPLEAGAWHYGEDLDGDGDADLLLVSGARLTLYSGVRPGAPLARPEALDLSSLLGTAEPGRTEVSLSLAAEDSVEKTERPGPARHQILETTGDATSEVLLWRVGAGEASTRLVIVSLVR